MRVWCSQPGPALTWNFSVTLRNSLPLWPLWLHNEPWQAVVFLEDVGRSKWGKVHINDFVSVLRKAHGEPAGEIHVGKVTQWQRQYWNPLLPGSQSTVPTPHSKLARALCPGDPRVAVAYTPFHLVPSQLLEGSFIVDFSIFRKDFFYYLHFHRVEKPFWPTSWQNLLTSLNTTQLKEWGEPWRICVPERHCPSPTLYLGCWWHSKSIIFPK